jgi:hypothetical protein
MGADCCADAAIALSKKSEATGDRLQRAMRYYTIPVLGQSNPMERSARPEWSPGGSRCTIFAAVDGLKSCRMRRSRTSIQRWIGRPGCAGARQVSDGPEDQRPQWPRMPRGWRCGARFTASQMRTNLTDWSKRARARSLRGRPALERKSAMRARHRVRASGQRRESEFPCGTRFRLRRM